MTNIKTVKVYSAAFCPWCTKAKDFLKQHNIAFEEVDIGNDKKAAEEMVKKTGQRTIPVLEINGKFIIGFNKQKIEQELGIED